MVSYQGQQSMSADPEEEIKRESSNPIDEPLVSQELIEDKLNQGKTKFREFYDNCSEAEEFYLGEFDFDVPETGSLVRLGTSQSVINSLVAHVTPQF